MNNIFKKGFYILAALVLGLATSCDDDDSQFSEISGLDFVIATLNVEGTEIGVVPTTVNSNNQIIYTVDFGAITDASDDIIFTSGPMVTYEYPNEDGTYLITVLATLKGAAPVSITKEITIKEYVEEVTNPNPGGTSPIAGTWKLAPEAGALGVGPAKDDVSWWSSDASTVTDRACLFDDEYIFNADGTFQNNLGVQTWVEPWQGGAAEECGAPVFPHDGTASATYTYDETAGTITIDGKGAFLGLAKAFNGGELASPADAPDSITYIAVITGGNTMDLDIEIAGGGFWSFRLTNGAAPANPLVGTWKLAPEAGSLGVGPAKDDVSWWSSGADVPTERACLFDDEYVFNADGTFENILGTETWLEPWQGADPEVCGAPIFPHDGTASATYSYDATAGTITIDGRGAYLGLAKAFNLGELAMPSDAVDSITYIAVVDGDTMDLDIEIAGGGFWTFKLTKGDSTPPAATIVGTWKLAQEAGALGVGPAKEDVSWWSSSADVPTERACLFDDEYVFNADGTFENIVGTETWLEPWQGVDPEACGAPIFPHDGTASATYSHDETAGTITIDGRGAYLGLAKVFNLGELTMPSGAVDSITYIAVITGNTMDLDIEIAGGGFWTFKLTKQ